MGNCTRIHYYRVDLNKPMFRQSYGVLGEGDDDGDVFVFSLVRNGAVLALTSAVLVTGYFVRPDGNTVILKGEIADNKASITLPQSCYVKEGRSALTVKATIDGATTTIAMLDGFVRQTTTDAVVDPGTFYPSLEDLLNGNGGGSGGGGGVPGQTTPETFGAKGDGVTDDAAAIMQALASGKNVVFDGTKTYAVGSTITIPANAFVDFRGATVVPMGNHDVIRAMPGCQMENLIVRCADAPGWNSSAVVFYGGDEFRAFNPTRLNNIKLYNDQIFNNGPSVGTGFYLYMDKNGDRFIEGISVSDAMTCGFEYGIRMSDLITAEEYTGNGGFIGANNFPNYWSFKDKIGICIDSDPAYGITTNNFFTDLNIQSDYYGSSQYAIYCRGDSNYFSGCLYDYIILDYHPATAVYFDVGSTKNYVEVTAGHAYKPEFCVDLGAYNRVVKSCYKGVVTSPANGDIGMVGNQDDAFAFLDRRAVCTLDSLDVEPASGNVSCVFDPSPNKVLTYYKDPSTGKCRAIITMNLRRVLRRMTHLILQFPFHRSPSAVKVTVFTDKTAIVVCDTTTNLESEIIVSPRMDEIGQIENVAKIVIEVGGTYSYGGLDSPYWSISRIMAVDGYETGNAWLRRDGGEVYGNVRFAGNSGPVLISEGGKWFKLLVAENGALSTVEIPVEEEEDIEVAVLVPTMAAGPAWYNADLAGAAANTITSVVFDAAYEPTGNEDASWPCDDGGIGYIMAYRTGTEVVITPTTGSDNIKLNIDSSYMFAASTFAALASVTGTEMWVAENNTSMAYVLYNNAIITDPVCVPEGVTVMTRAFSNCSALTTPPVLPEGLTTMSNAFQDAHALREIPVIPSTVINMPYAFMTCSSVTSVNAVIPARVKNMDASFRNCFRMNGNIEVNAANLTSYSNCFVNTCRDDGSVTLTGSCPLLAELAATNTQGKVTVAS